MDTYIRDQVLRKNKLFDDPTSIFRRLGMFLYQGYVPTAFFNNANISEFHHVKDYHEQVVYDKNGKRVGTRKIDTLNMPKIVTSFLKRITMGEGYEFAIDNDEDGEKQKFFEDILSINNFDDAESDNLELMLNGGDKLLVIGYRRQSVRISYLNGFKFEVVEYEQGRAKSVVLYTDKVRQDEKNDKMYFYTLLEYHKLHDDDDEVEPYYEIRREIYQSQERYKLERGVRFNEHIGIFGNFEEHEQFDGVDVPMFVFTRSPYRNNKQLDTIRGLGLMINALDVNRSIDRTFDANNREIDKTKFQIIVPDEMLEHAYDKDGNTIDFYNTDTSWYSGLNAGDGFQFEPIIVSPPIRQEAYTAKLSQDLDIMCMQLGLSPGTLSFDKHLGRVTATQVVAEMDETHRTKVEIGNALTRGWREMIWSIYRYAKDVWKLIDWQMEKDDIKWELKDSVIIDDEAEFKKDMEAVREGLMPKREFLMKHYGLGDTEAEEWLSRIDSDDFEAFEDLIDAEEDAET